MRMITKGVELRINFYCKKCRCRSTKFTIESREVCAGCRDKGAYKCRECGQYVYPDEYHTLKHCKEFHKQNQEFKQK